MQQLLRRFLRTLVITTALFTLPIAGLRVSHAQATPSDYNFPTPLPAPALPAGMNPFALPLLGGVSGPKIAEFTRSGKPDDTITLAGPDFNSATRFRFYGQTTATNAVILERGVSFADGTVTSVILPSPLPTWSTYFVWPRSGRVYGMPVAVNRTDAWWIGSNQAIPGDTVSVFGRNLAHDNGTSTSWIYIKPIGQVLGQWVNPTAVNPYKVDFPVPSLAAGTYEVWSHNGHGGNFGWSGPLRLTILAASPYAGQADTVINVRTFGAVGNGSTDDTDAITNALAAARNAAPATLYFPAGTYIINKPLIVQSGVTWVGEDRDTTFLQPGLTFNADGSNYPMIFSGYRNSLAAINIGFKNLTFAWNSNNSHSTNNVSLLMNINAQDFVKLSNCRLNWKGLLGGVSLAENTHIEIVGNEFIGDGLFIGSAQQVKIKNNLFRLTDYASSTITSWGGNEIEVSGNQAQDFDSMAASASGVGSGRFYISQSHPDSNRNLYIGDNTTVNMAPTPGLGDANQGEQILLEVGTSFASLQPVSATSTTATFTVSPPLSTPDGIINSQESFIVKGRGAGQSRHITSVNGKTITVFPAWAVIPDASSVIGMGGAQTNAVVYHNQLDGKSSYATQETASVGLSMYGNVTSVVFANNTLTDMRNGLADEYCQASNVTTPTPSAAYFNLVTDNTLNGAYRGVGLQTNYLTQNMPGTIGHLGNTYRRNTLSSLTAYGIRFYADGQGFSGGNLYQDVFEHNTITGVPILLSVGSGSLSGTAPINTLFQNIHLYANTFDRGSAPFAGSKAFDILGSTTSFWRSGNYWIGFETSSVDPDPIPGFLFVDR